MLLLVIFIYLFVCFFLIVTVTVIINDVSVELIKTVLIYFIWFTYRNALDNGVGGSWVILEGCGRFFCVYVLFISVSCLFVVLLFFFVIFVPLAVMDFWIWLCFFG